MALRPLTPVVLLLLVSLSCSTPNKPESESRSSDLIPLATGNQWNTIKTAYDTLGNAIHVFHDSLLIRGDTVINGIRWWWTNDGNRRIQPPTHTLGFANTDSGIIVRITSPNTRPGPALRYPSSQLIGQSIPYPEIPLNDPNAVLVDSIRSITLVLTDTTISVPAGSFRCNKYQLLLPNGLCTNIYISPGFGWIRMDEFDAANPGGKIFLRWQTATDRIRLVN